MHYRVIVWTLTRNGDDDVGVGVGVGGGYGLVEILTR